MIWASTSSWFPMSFTRNNFFDPGLNEIMIQDFHMGCHHGSRSCPTLPSASNLPVAVTIVIAVICQNVSLNVNQVFGLDDTNTWRKRHRLHAVACFGRNFECHVIYRPQRWKSSCEISSHVNSRPAVATDNNYVRYLTLQKPLERRVVSNHQ